jgi:hypothetical protein
VRLADTVVAGLAFVPNPYVQAAAIVVHYTITYPDARHVGDPAPGSYYITDSYGPGCGPVHQASSSSSSILQGSVGGAGSAYLLQ